MLKSEEYDASYFDGKSQPLAHNAGYSTYQRWLRHEGDRSEGEYFRDLAKRIVTRFPQMVGKTCLEIGCAKGFVVKDLRDFGVDCYGLDVSQYAIDNAEPGMSPYLTVGDIRDVIPTYSNNQWDVLFSLRFLECMPDSALDNFITHCNRVSKKQFHVIGLSENSSFYKQRTMEWVMNKGWAQNTKIFVSHNLDGEKTK